MSPLFGSALLALLLHPLAGLAADARTIIDGCEGEGCDCYQGYRADDKAVKDYDIKTIRPFLLYADMDKNSKLIGKYGAGVMARPLGTKIVIHQRGEYLVKKVMAPDVSLKKGDKLDTLLYSGEGYYSAQKGGSEVSFKEGDVELKTIKKTRASGWLQVILSGKTGFTQDSPFEGCLE